MSAIEDRLAINDLFVRYTTALDAGDVETVVGCFTADAVLESPAIGVIAGCEAIRAFASRFAALRKDGTQFRHMIAISPRRTRASGPAPPATSSY